MRLTAGYFDCACAPLNMTNLFVSTRYFANAQYDKKWLVDSDKWVERIISEKNFKLTVQKIKLPLLILAANGYKII